MSKKQNSFLMRANLYIYIDLRISKLKHKGWRKAETWEWWNYNTTKKTRNKKRIELITDKTSLLVYGPLLERLIWIYGFEGWPNTSGSLFWDVSHPGAYLKKKIIEFEFKRNPSLRTCRTFGWVTGDW